MRFEGDFYKIKRIECLENGQFNAVVEISAKHQIFDGHFPEQAVVPGVCTLMMVKDCLSKIKHREILFSSIKECKYLSALFPAEGLKIVLDFTFTETSLMGMVKRYDTGHPVLKLKANYK